MKEKIICRCEEITEKEIDSAIKDGATTISGVKRRTRAGMGFCQGRTCQRLIARMLSKVKDSKDIYPATARPVVRNVKIRELLNKPKIEGDNIGEDL